MRDNKCGCGRDLMGEDECGFCRCRQAAWHSLSARIRADLKQIRHPEDAVKRDLGIINERLKGRGLYFYGPTGSGKTLYAAALLMASFDVANIGGCKFFVALPDLLDSIKNTYGNRGVPSESEGEIIHKYSTADLLVMDDLGVERTTDWAYNILNSIISHRYERMKSTIFTSNVDLNHLAAKLGDNRISSRIYQMCEVRLFDYKDMRVTP
jgi:DNA replication protein DnaC